MDPTPHLPTPDRVDNSGVSQLPSVSRRSFVQALLTLATAGDKFVAISNFSQVVEAAVETSHPPEIGQLVIESVLRLCDCETALGQATQPFDFYHRSMRAIAATIQFHGDQPIMNANLARQAVNALYLQEKEKIEQLLQVREETLAILHKNRSAFVQIAEAVMPADTKINLGNFSGVLSSENARLTVEQAAALAREESREIAHLSVDKLFDVGRSAATAPTAYQTPDGRKVHRQVDGTFKMEPDPKWHEIVKSPETTSRIRDSDMLDRIARSFSPEMYAYSSMPPSRFSLAVEYPALTHELHRHFINRVHEDLGAGKLPPMLEFDLVRARIDHLLSPINENGDAYLRIIEAQQEQLPQRVSGRRDDFELYRNPRAELGVMVTAFRLEYIRCGDLKEQMSFLGIKFHSNYMTGAWAGPFAKDKASAIVHDMLAQSVIELVAERKLFFLNYPVVSLSHFKAIAGNFKNDPAFASMFIDLYARLLNKKVNLGAYFNMMMKREPHA